MRATRFAVLLVVTAVALTGCATGSSSRRLQAGDPLGTTQLAATPGSASTKPGLSIVRWWTTYDDENLNALVNEALAHNYDHDVALGRVREAQAVVDQVRAAQLPTVDAQLRASRAQQSIASGTPVPPGFDRRATSYGASSSCHCAIAARNSAIAPTASLRASATAPRQR